MLITVLGCGASTGVPVVGCSCDVCKDGRNGNIRRRSSLFIHYKGTNLLIDSGMDFRKQLLELGYRELDAVLYTHTHPDHCHGLDDLRCSALYTGSPVEVYGTQDVLNELYSRFGYIFNAPKHGYATHCHLAANTIEHGVEFNIGDLTIRSFHQKHGDFVSSGFIIKNGESTLVYSTDVSYLSDEQLAELRDLRPDVWVLDCIGYMKSYAHGPFDLVMSWIDAVDPVSTVLTHMSHSINYYTMPRTMRSEIMPAYDMMRIKI